MVIFSLEEADFRPVRETDLELILTWRNTEHIRCNMFHDQIIVWDEHVQWFQKLQRSNDQEIFLFSLSGVPIGAVNFTGIDRQTGVCEWGFYIGNSDSPRGNGTIMGFLALEYAFRKLKMNRVIGECFEFNEASARHHEKLGFSFVGFADQCIDRGGLTHKIRRYMLNVETWNDRRQELYFAVFGDSGRAMRGG
jgi:UDP-4-amino-4,6-dideoxy-N-acetyl-beta-L-altrosamine N-acetyltransferase